MTMDRPRPVPPVSLERLLSNPVEAFKNAVVFLWGNANAVIGNGDHGLIVIFLEGDGHLAFSGG